MNRLVAVALLTFMTGSLALSTNETDRREPFGLILGSYAVRATMCHGTLSLNPIEFLDLLVTTKHCIVQQTGLLELIESILQHLSSLYFPGSVQGRSLERGSLKYLSPAGRQGEEEDTDIALILDNNGFKDEAYELRKCIATEMGMAELDDLVAWIKENVAGLPIYDNVVAAIALCSYEEYKVNEYLDCIKYYCVMGASVTADP